VDDGTTVYSAVLRDKELAVQLLDLDLDLARAAGPGPLD